MNSLLLAAGGIAALLVSDVSSAQSGHMMNDGIWNMGWMGGHGGIWVPILVVSAVAVLVAWVVKGRNK